MTTTETFTITRDGDRDIEFDGVLLGQGSHGTGGNSDFVSDWNRGTDVAIYRTKGGRYVVHVNQWSRWQGEDGLDRAAVLDDARGVLSWLVDDCGGALGPASKEAFEQASSADSALADIVTERVE